MRGKKKAKFYTLCSRDGIVCGESIKYICEVEGWTKDGLGYSRIGPSHWKMTDLASGLGLPGAYRDIDEAYENYLHNISKVVEKKKTKEYQENKECFERLVKEAGGKSD